MEVRRVFSGCGVVNPHSVHNELVLIPAWFQRNAPFPRSARPASEHAQASRRPFIEISAQINDLCFRLVQRKQHACSVRSLRLISVGLLPGDCFRGVYVLPFKEKRVRAFLFTRLKSATFHYIFLPFSGGVVGINACHRQRSGIAQVSECQEFGYSLFRHPNPRPLNASSFA
jgi:hypothetical protein